MLARLRDKQPAIRCQAALALARLADPGEVTPMTRSLLAMTVLHMYQVSGNLASGPRQGNECPDLSHVLDIWSYRSDRLPLSMGRYICVHPKSYFITLKPKVQLRALTPRKRRLDNGDDL